MSNLSTERKQSQLPDFIKRVKRHKKRITVTGNGKKLAAVVPIEDVEALEKIEDRIDREEARKAKAEPGENGNWDDLKKELGL